MLETEDVLLRCRLCRCEKRFMLNRDQSRRLSEVGHLKLRCGYCGSSQFWESAEMVEVTSYVTSPVLPRRNKPLGGGEADASGIKVAEPSVPAKPKSILVVDDDDLTVKLLQKVLEAWDAKVEIALNGKEALTKLAAEPFDLLVCDIRMPEMTGQELFQHVQENGYLPPQRILFLTGEKSAAVKQFLDASGCYYLYKPLQFLDFSGQIQAILAGENLR
jgi:CheY-like chemotaxis protein